MKIKKARKEAKEKRSRGEKRTAKTAQRSIPLVEAHEDGIFEVEKGRYSCSMKLEDINYQTARREEQETIFTHYCELLNLFNSLVSMQITIHNRSVSRQKFEEQVLLNKRNDEFDGYREEWNQMLQSKMEEGKSSIRKEKYLTLSTEAGSTAAARDTLSRLEFEISDLAKKMGSQAKQLPLQERLETLHDVYRPDHVGEFHHCDPSEYKRQGISVQDTIAADGMEFKRDHFMIGSQYAQALFLKAVPTFLTDQILDVLTDFPFNLMLTMHIQPMDPGDALTLIRRRITGMESNKMDYQRKAMKGGYIEPFIPFSLRNSLEEANELMDDVVNKDQKLFLTSIVILHMADTKEELLQNGEAIYAAARKKGCQAGVLNYQQEAGLNSALPMGLNRLKIDRCLTTESTAIFIPFSAQELLQKKGFYYGRNASSGNLIIFNRLTLKTPAGFILGTPGSGKSFLTKREIINLMLATGDDVIIIDPEREYTKLVQAFGGQVVHISAASKNYINPMDITEEYSTGEEGQSEDPLLLKSDFVMSLFEAILGGNAGLTPKQKSIVDRCLRAAYQPLMTRGWDKNYMPTLKDFHAIMLEQKEEEAADMAVALEMYVLGNLHVFSHPTNVDIHNRVICYDTKDLGKQLKTMGMLIVLDAVWNRITANRESGKRTWLYVDEMSLFFQSEYLSTYFDEVYRRFRKWGGVPTGITQNIKPMLKSETARTMLSNSEFIIIMNQAKSDRDELASLLNISDSLLEYVTNAEEGYGLLSIGKSVIPFRDKFPKNTQLYRMMTTKIDEISTQSTQTWKL